jgi:translation initiation factor 1
LLEQQFKSLKGLIESWEVPAESEAASQLLKSKIDSLLIRLILKSGKRQGVKKEITCVHCNNVFSACTCGQKKADGNSAAPKKKGDIINVRLERKGRGGKTVTVATGFSLDDKALESLTTELKKACGSGGTLKDRQIEIQGDCRARLKIELEKRGFRAK